ncbi:Rapid ALkalinization Factor [Heracleum sosnowskyi]|uniref:Rapid ALkalinization Factor n=1 Tax=Heracleum sosnowskyi TaxID=360622 RepID=A0AAD8NEC1_9APIA|nr:Rapid ALkalinization Factor [Heracleum sosnowskyi]
MSSQSILLILLICISYKTVSVSSQIETLTANLQWPSATSGYAGVELELDEDQEETGMIERRSLYWRSMHYYISYGALSANRIPCPARSGRSYYTHNCHSATGPAHPYTRGCSAITRCRR